MSEWILWGISLLTILGSILNIKQMNLCFWIWSFCNIFWLLCDILNGTYSRAALDVVNLATSIWGLISWSKKSKNSNKRDENEVTNDSVEA